MDGFDQYLIQKDVLGEDVFLIEKTLIYFSKESNKSKINTLIGLEKMANLMVQPSIREKLSSTYGIDDHWIHKKAGEIELFSNSNTAKKPYKKELKTYRYFKRYRNSILNSLRKLKHNKTSAFLKLREQHRDDSAQNITRIKKLGIFIVKKTRKLSGKRKNRGSYLKKISSGSNIDEKHLAHKPLISVIMPCYNSNIKWLKEAIDSVINQNYKNWELCIVDDASTDTDIQKTLTKYCSSEKRIKVIKRQVNGHISNASNTALSMAKGEWVTFIDHDDAIPPNALYELITSINSNPHLRLIYSDEEKIDEKGNRFDPHYKSDWNPDLLFSQNYICHLTAIHESVMKCVEGFRSGFEGSQDYDLILRCVRHLEPNQIHHIPKILYYWRAAQGSTALDPNEKDYSTDAGIKALDNYFNESGIKAVVQRGAFPTTYRVKYSIPDPKPLVSLIIPTRDQLELTRKCITSILEKTSYKNFEVIIVNNKSIKPETTSYFNLIKSENPNIKILDYNKVFNYSAINNFAVSFCSGSIIGLLNNDIEVISEEWLTEMVSHACRSEIGCVGAKLYYPNDTIQHAGVILGIGGVAGHSHKYYPKNHHGYFSRLKLTQNLSAVTGACLVVRKEVFKEVGGFDENNLKIAFNDVDLCLKVRESGYRNIWTPYAELIHHESVSRGSEDTSEKTNRFNSEVDYMITKWGTILESDPYYNPNLTNIKEDFSYKL
jgi:GT2 family glycosyltransferase